MAPKDSPGKVLTESEQFTILIYNPAAFLNEIQSQLYDTQLYDTTGKWVHASICFIEQLHTVRKYRCQNTVYGRSFWLPPWHAYLLTCLFGWMKQVQVLIGAIVFEAMDTHSGVWDLSLIILEDVFTTTDHVNGEVFERFVYLSALFVNAYSQYSQ